MSVPNEHDANQRLPSGYELALEMLQRRLWVQQPPATTHETYFQEAMWQEGDDEPTAWPQIDDPARLAQKIRRAEKQARRKADRRARAAAMPHYVLTPAVFVAETRDVLAGMLLGELFYQIGPCGEPGARRPRCAPQRANWNPKTDLPRWYVTLPDLVETMGLQLPRHKRDQTIDYRRVWRAIARLGGTPPAEDPQPGQKPSPTPLIDVHVGEQDPWQGEWRQTRVVNRWELAPARHRLSIALAPAGYALRLQVGRALTRVWPGHVHRYGLSPALVLSALWSLQFGRTETLHSEQCRWLRVSYSYLARATGLWPRCWDGKSIENPKMCWAVRQALILFHRLQFVEHRQQHTVGPASWRINAAKIAQIMAERSAPAVVLQQEPAEPMRRRKSGNGSD